MAKAKPQQQPPEPTPLETRMVEIAVLSAHPRNAREHPPGQIKQIADSIRAFGFNDIVEVDEDMTILSGHGRVEAAKLLGMDAVPCRILTHLTDVEKRAYMLAANRIAENAEVNKLMTALEIAELSQAGIVPSLMGFSDKAQLKEYSALVEETTRKEDTDSPDLGRMLELVSVTIDDPTAEVKLGDVWAVGQHRLYVMSVVDSWPEWVQGLNEKHALFVPYPGVYVPLSDRAANFKLVMVQPDLYIAGHMLDRYAEVHGGDKLTLIKRHPSA